MSRSALSPMRSSRMGRSPEIPCPHKPDCTPLPRRIASDGGRSDGPANTRCAARVWNRSASRGAMPRWRNWTCACVQASVEARSNAAASRCLSMAPTRASRVPAAIVQNATRTVAPAATVTRQRRENTASSTVPTVLDRSRPSMAAASRTLRPRPRKRARSVSAWMPLWAAPFATSRCAAQTSGSVGVRRRRVARMAPPLPDASPWRSVCTNILAKAGCAMSSAGRLSATSANEVISIVRAVVPAFVTEIRRTSASSSADTRTSIMVVSVPSRRANSARSSLKATSYSSGVAPMGCNPADQTRPLPVSRSRM